MMDKFVLLYLSPVTAEQQMSSQMSPEAGRKAMDAWMAWYKKAGSAVLDQGTPLGNGKSLSNMGEAMRQTKVAGYSIVQAKDIDAVEKMLKGHPHLIMPGASIEIMESMPMENMPMEKMAMKM